MVSCHILSAMLRCYFISSGKAPTSTHRTKLLSGVARAEFWKEASFVELEKETYKSLSSPFCITKGELRERCHWILSKQKPRQTNKKQAEGPGPLTSEWMNERSIKVRKNTWSKSPWGLDRNLHTHTHTLLEKCLLSPSSAHPLSDKGTTGRLCWLNSLKQHM